MFITIINYHLQGELERSRVDFNAIAEWIGKNISTQDTERERSLGETSAQTCTNLDQTDVEPPRQLNGIEMVSPEEFYYKRMSCKYQQIETPPHGRNNRSTTDQECSELFSPYDNKGFVEDDQILATTVQDCCVVQMPS